MNKQLTLAIKLFDEARLDNFHWNKNELLKEQIEMMLAFKADKLLYLWGPAGSGKTHLLQACCQAFYLKEESAIYLPLKVLKEWGPEALDGLEDQRLICIDDVLHIAKDAAFEEALFHLYNKIKDEDKSLLIISGSLSPAQLPLYLKDLRSRLCGGLVIQLHELNDEEKINILKAQAKKRGFDLSDSVSHFLLNRCSRSMHDLHQVLNHLDEASLAAQRKITIPFVKEFLNI